MSTPIPTGLKRVVAASMAGTVVEWYEFFLYGTAATLVFSKVFFSPRPTASSNTIIAAFVTYAVGFIARPLGGVVFGHFGDKYGRKKLLQFSLLLVGAATFLMGCLPTFGQVGYWAPALLVALRFIQGFAVGGEWGGAVLLVAEHSPNQQRGFWASWPQAGVPAGNLLATVVLLVLTGDADGCRVPVLGLAGRLLAVRRGRAGRLLHPHQGHRCADLRRGAAGGRADQGDVVRVVEVLKRYPRGVFTAMGLRFGENIMYYLVVTFSITYLKVAGRRGHQLDPLVSARRARRALRGRSRWSGRLADRFGRRPVYFVGAALGATGASSPSR